MGDGTLMEFGSVVDAIRFAVDVQRAVALRNTDVPEDQRITYRIGINIGDIIVEDDDIYGDGVNVAARLEALAEPGGICVARNVYNQVKGKVDTTFEDLGAQEIKNIPEPVQVYKVLLDAPAADHGAVIAVTAKRSLRWPMVAGSLVVLVIMMGGILWQRPWEPREEPALDANMAFPLPDKPSIAVLPFSNMSGDPEQEYFSDGITEDIITGLSRVRTFLVIARNSSFAYKGRSPDIRKVASDLGVRYVLEGSVRKAGNRVRITAQLIDAATGAHLWADRYDREIVDIFAVQDEITQTVVGAIEPELSRAEQQRALMKPPESLDAWDLYSRGLWYFARHDKENNGKAQELFARATEWDANFCAAHAYLVFAKFLSVVLSFTEDRNATIEEMLVIGRKALAADGSDAFAHLAIAGAHLIRSDAAPAIEALDRAIELNPSFPMAYTWLGDAHALVGETEKAIARAETAMRLSPADPQMSSFMVVPALANIVAQRFDEAESWARKATRQSSAPPIAYMVLLASLGHSERRTEAASIHEEFLNRFPDYDMETFFNSSRWTQSPDRAEIFREGFRKAGLPE